jgi:hypothetical protein
VQERQVERLEREAPPGPAKQLSVDGARVPRVGGEWAEVKTLAVGEVEPPVQHKGETVIRTRDMTYFSRLTDSNTFQRLALVETHRRGVETAGAVGAVTDGSEWCQSLVDFHRPDAVRILDFPHAGEHLGQVGQAVWGEGVSEAQTWLTDPLHQLKHDGPVSVLATVRQLEAAYADQPDIAEHLAYLEKREPHLQYPAFQAAGWPIGEGAVESGNKLVVEARLKGSGMHWARPPVDPMLALRNIACNDRWEEAWPQIVTELRRRTTQRRSEQRASYPKRLLSYNPLSSRRRRNPFERPQRLSRPLCRTHPSRLGDPLLIIHSGSLWCSRSNDNWRSRGQAENFDAHPLCFWLLTGRFLGVYLKS